MFLHFTWWWSQVTDCTKSVEGYTCLYISHGGGRKLLIALKVLKATQVSAFHMVAVASKVLFLFIYVSLDFFSIIFSMQFASSKELYTLHMVCCLDSPHNARRHTRTYACTHCAAW
jgi:hypothetical protein